MWHSTSLICILSRVCGQSQSSFAEAVLSESDRVTERAMANGFHCSISWVTRITIPEPTYKPVYCELLKGANLCPSEIVAKVEPAGFYVICEGNDSCGILDF